MLKKWSMHYLSLKKLTQLNKLMDLVGRAFSIEKVGSDAQPLSALEKELVGKTGGLSANALKGNINNARLQTKLSGQVGDEVVNIAIKQSEAYYKALADILFITDASKSIDGAYNYLSGLEYFGKQAGARAIIEGVETII